MTVRELSDELNVPAGWIIGAFLYAGAMKTLYSELTDGEVALAREQAPRWKAGDPPPTGLFAIGKHPENEDPTA